MFPAGGPGIGLLLLRIAIAAALFLDGPPGTAVRLAHGYGAMLIALGAAVCAGVVTPVLAILCGVLAVVEIVRWGFLVSPVAILLLLDAAVLGLLGPGAYSVDARLFGRRVLVLSEKRDE